MLQYKNNNVVLRTVIRGSTAATIAASAEQAIHAGSLAPGGSLPTIRDLAATLHVSPVTVAAAYRRLQVRGLLVSEGRRGTRVRTHPPTPSAHTALRHVSRDLIDLATGNPDPDLLPPLEAALRGLDSHRPMYGAPQHLKPLITFAAAEFAADGIPADAVTVTSGALDAVERLLREHLRPGDRVGVEDPTVPALLDLLSASGFVSEPIDVDEEGPRPDAFERVVSRARAVVLTPRAQNPTGAALSSGRAADLKHALRPRRDLLVIEDDAAGPVAGAPCITLCDGAPASWAVVRSTSAFLGPDLRVAVVAGDAVTIARMQGRQALGTRWVSHLLQQLALGLWSDPSNGRRLARAAEIYAYRRRAMLDALASHQIRAVGRSGFNVWIPVPEETATVQALGERGWAVAAGERFRLRSAPAIRVTTSALEPDAAQRFAADFAELFP
jgi:DNA-binding transcriptional MocR family regulator